MKDKSRFISSIIVSLLAGFIYYQFGDNIKEIQSSVKAVLSYNDADMYLPIAPQSFTSTVKKSGSTSNKKKSKFYLRKKSTIELKTKDAVIPGDQLLSDLISETQAKFRKPAPDKNIDFTAELQNLIKNDPTKSSQRQGKVIKGSKSLSTTTYEVAEVNLTKTRAGRLRDNFDKSQNEYKFKYYKGNGFEYNYIIKENSSSSSNSSNETNSTCKSKCEQQKSEMKKFKMENKMNNMNNKKIKIIAPKSKNNSDMDPEEINIPVNSCDDDSM